VENERPQLDASRGGTFAGVDGSVNAVCGAKRARPSVFESKHFGSSTSLVVMSGK
jgi:hypothetical protein